MKTGARGQMIQKIWSQRLSQKLIPCMAKDTLENYKINSRKPLLFPSCDCPPGGTLRHLYKKKNIYSFYLIKTKTFHLWGIKTSIPSEYNDSKPPAQRANHILNIFANYLILFRFSRLSGLRLVSLRPRSSQRTLKLQLCLHCLHWT